MASYNRAERTRTVARIVGPYLMVAAIALAVRLSALPALFATFMADDGLVFATGAFTLMAGLSLFAAHHHWNGVNASLISSIAIIAAVKGASLMIAPQINNGLVETIAVTPSVLCGAVAVEGAIGAWLTIVGWRPGSAPRLPT